MSEYTDDDLEDVVAAALRVQRSRDAATCERLAQAYLAAITDNMDERDEADLRNKAQGCKECAEAVTGKRDA